MFKPAQKLLAVVVILAIPFPSSATKTTQAAAPAKTYELVDLKQVVSNSDKCAVIHHSLEELAKKPFSLQFSPSADSKQHIVKHVDSEVKNHSNMGAKQVANGNKFQRTSFGSLKLKNEKIDYVMEISANLDNHNHQYLYPIILSGDEAQCYYTALVKPDTQTVESFKKSIVAGAATKEVDLHQNYH